MNNSDENSDENSSTITIIENWIVLEAIDEKFPEIGKPLLIQAIVLHNTKDQGKFLIEVNLDQVKTSRKTRVLGSKTKDKADKFLIDEILS